MKNFYPICCKQIFKRISCLWFVFVLFSLFGQGILAQIATTIPASRCGEGSVVLHATTSSGTIKWYSVPFYGTAITDGISSDGTTFTTPLLVVTTTYYVDAVDATGCSLNTGKKRVPVTASINASSMQASIFYSSTTFCKSVNTEQEVTRTGSSGGTFSYTGTGTLSLNSSTGAITPSLSDNGTYTIIYTVVAAEGCTENPASTTISIADAPLTSSISYSGSPFCTSETSIPVILTNPNSGTFSASPSGLSINASTGTINPSLSLPGTYTVTYFVSSAGGCAPQSPTTSITITGLPTAALSYTGAPFCYDISATQSPTLSGTGAYTGGAYSYTGTGTLSLNTSTGAIIPSTSTAGTYTVNYTISPSGNCASVVEHTSVTINPLPTASITGNATVCQNATEPNVTFTGLTGTAPFTFIYQFGTGTDQSITTVSGNSVALVQPTVTAGTYQYKLKSVTDANGCSQAASGTVVITVIGTPVADFSYIGSPFCKIGSVKPTLAPGGSAGTFSGTNVVFVSTSTGEIDLANTPDGTYDIKNTISTCGDPIEATTSITINKLPTATISGSTACGASTLTANTNATAASFVWYQNGEVIPNETSSTLIASANGDYTVKVTDGTTNCSFTSSPYTVTLIALPTASITGTFATCVDPTTLTAVSDAASPTYVWYKNDEEISGQTAGTLIATASGNYKVKVRNGSTTCEKTSAAVFVSIALDDDPGTVNGGQTVCTGANSTSLTLDGTKSSVLRWESSISPFTSWTQIVNTTTNYAATGLTQTTKYRAVVQNGICPQKNSVEATVTVVPDPTISTQPVASTSECIGGTAQLSVTAANGTGGYTYQWYTNGSTNSNSGGTLIESATASTYTPPTTVAGTIYYYVIVGANGNACNSVTSDVAAITVVPDQPSWTNYSNPTPTTLCVGETVAFSVSVTGGSGGTISWVRSATSGGAGTTVTTGDTPAIGTWYYRPQYTPTSSGCTLADGTSTTVIVKSITTAPAITSITSAASTVVTGTSEANAAITVYKAGTTSIGTTTADGSGNWTVTVTGLAANDVVTAKAIATDKCVSAASTGKTIPAAPTGNASQSFCSGVIVD